MRKTKKDARKQNRLHLTRGYRKAFDKSLPLLLGLLAVVHQDDEAVRERSVSGHHSSLERGVSCGRKVRDVGVCPTLDNQSDCRLQRACVEQTRAAARRGQWFSRGLRVGGEAKMSYFVVGVVSVIISGK